MGRRGRNRRARGGRLKRDRPLLENALREIEQQHLTRVRSTLEAVGEDGRRVSLRCGGRRLIDFSGNDYLGLAYHPEVSAAMCAAATQLGAGSGASHLVTGHGLEHAKLEEELADFVGRERALLFSTGYMANLAVVTTLAGRGESVVMDKLSHASLIDAGLLSGARFRRYPHTDVAAAGRILDEESSAITVLATDGVFSMDGDIAPLPELARLSSMHGAWLVVDDAHGLGVVGATGRGSQEHFGLSKEEVPVLVGTLGKAFGSFGAFVAGSSDLIELLLQKARSYIYTTALPQAVAAATRKAVELARQESWRRERVLALAERFRTAAKQSAIPLGDSSTPIQPVILGDAPAALQAQQDLADAGFRVVAIRPPTVPSGAARLRVTFSAEHTEAEVDALVRALAETTTARRDGRTGDPTRRDAEAGEK